MRTYLDAVRAKNRDQQLRTSILGRLRALERRAGIPVKDSLEKRLRALEEPTK